MKGRSRKIIKGSPNKTLLDQILLEKIAKKENKDPQYIRERICKKANRMGITSEAAQIVWASELEIGYVKALRRLEPHIQEQVQTALLNANTKEHSKREKSKNKTVSEKNIDPIGIASSILLSDEELKSRCKDLLKKRHHLDRVLREATTILENRIRSLSGISNKCWPEELVNKAINPDPMKAILIFSSTPSEQIGFHSIYKGIVLAFRHPAHHALDDKVTQQYALKFCAFIDMLLDILQKARKNV